MIGAVAVHGRERGESEKKGRRASMLKIWSGWREIER